jgi:hypothetical protein
MGKLHYLKLFLVLILNFCFLEGKVEWNKAIPLSASSEFVGDAKGGVDRKGNAIAVWTKFNGFEFITRASTFDKKADKWSMPVTISPNGNSTVPQVTVNPSGVAIAVWSIEDRNSFVVQAATTDIETHSKNIWSSPVTLSEHGKNAVSPQVGIDNKGNAFAIWVLQKANRSAIQVSKYNPCKGSWSKPIDISHVELVDMPQIAVNANGNAIAIWQGFIAGYGVIQAAVYHPEKNRWSKPINLSALEQSSNSPQIAIDGHGNAIAVWRNFDGNHFIIQSTAYTKELNKWDFPVVAISTPGFDSYDPQIAISKKPLAISVWRTFDGRNFLLEGAQSSTRTPNVWNSLPKSPLSNIGESASIPRLDINSFGKAVAVWSDSSCGNPNEVILSAALDLENLTTEVRQLSRKKFTSVTPIVSINNEGKILTIWRQSQNGREQIISRMGNFISHSDKPLPPACIKGKQVLNCFAGRLNRTNIITWCASPTVQVDAYQVYKDGILIGRVSSDQELRFVDRSIKSGVQVLYEVTALEEKKESLPVSVIVHPKKVSPNLNFMIIPE